MALLRIWDRARPLSLRFLGEHVGKAVRINRFSCNHDVDRFAQPLDLSVRCFEMTEELLPDVLSGNAGPVIDVVLGEHLIRRLKMDLDVLKDEVGIERTVEETQKLRHFGGAGIHGRDAGGSKIGKLKRSRLPE
jgi:hypothetical protein